MAALDAEHQRTLTLPQEVELAQGMHDLKPPNAEVDGRGFRLDNDLALELLGMQQDMAMAAATLDAQMEALESLSTGCASLALCAVAPHAMQIEAQHEHDQQRSVGSGSQRDLPSTSGRVQVELLVSSVRCATTGIVTRVQRLQQYFTGRNAFDLDGKSSHHMTRCSEALSTSMMAAGDGTSGVDMREGLPPVLSATLADRCLLAAQVETRAVHLQELAAALEAQKRDQRALDDGARGLRGRCLEMLATLAQSEPPADPAVPDTDTSCNSTAALLEQVHARLTALLADQRLFIALQQQHKALVDTISTLHQELDTHASLEDSVGPMSPVDRLVARLHRWTKYAPAVRPDIDAEQLWAWVQELQGKHEAACGLLHRVQLEAQRLRKAVASAEEREAAAYNQCVALYVLHARCSNAAAWALHSLPHRECRDLANGCPTVKEHFLREGVHAGSRDQRMSRKRGRSCCESSCSVFTARTWWCKNAWRSCKHNATPCRWTCRRSWLSASRSWASRRATWERDSLHGKWERFKCGKFSVFSKLSSGIACHLICVNVWCKWLTTD
jgi:hypothetical protein